MGNQFQEDVIERSFSHNMEQYPDKKVLLLESALDLIKEHGFHGAPVSLVAKNAGVAAGTVYTYFQSKDELILEIYHYVKSQVLKELSTLDPVGEPFKNRFFSLWYNWISLYLKKVSFQSFLEQFTSSPYNTDELQEQDDPLDTWLYNFFKDGVESGALRQVDPRILMVMVKGNAISMVRFKVYFSKKVKNTDEELEMIPQMLWEAIRRQN